MREAELTKQLLAAGLGSLIKANHMETGLFSHAFFNLSIGLERLLKLIYIIDHVGQQGDVPTDETMRKKFSHDLEKLHAEARTIRERLITDHHTFRWAQPDPELTVRVIRVLAEFARTARYYNLDYLLNAKKLSRDPIQAWNDEVALYLMSDYPARLRRKDEEWAEEAQTLMASHALVRQETEGGLPLQSVSRSILHGRRGEWIQRKATFHCAAVTRELVEILLTVSDDVRGYLDTPHFIEYFALYWNDDSYLKGRRTFLL
jgi:hypothetical protein